MIIKKNGYLINFLRNKNNLIFSYITKKQKKRYENYINELFNISNKNILSLYNLVLYNYSQAKYNVLEYINSNGIYETDNELNLTHKFKNIKKIKNKINLKYNLNKEINEIHNKPLIPEIKDDDKYSFENQNPYRDDIFFNDIFFKILERICVVLFTIVITFAIFFMLHYIYYNNIDEESL